VTVGIAALGVSLLRGPVVAPVVDDHSAEEAIGLGLTTPPVAPTSGPLAPSGGSTVIPIVAVRLLDPYATDRAERANRVPRAWDGKPATAWTTLRYRDPSMGGKKGVGLLVDLGAPRPVSSVRLVLVGNNTTVAVRAGDTVARAPKGYRVFARAKGAPTEVTLRSVQPVTARYLAIWLTRLPPNGDAYRGGVAEVSVRS
jgi:putative peptidoglycan lipid II flippase